MGLSNMNFTLTTKALIAEALEAVTKQDELRSMIDF